MNAKKNKTMLKINRLRELVAEAVSELEALKVGKVVVTKDEISRFMKEHSEDENMLLIAIVPEHDISGAEDAWLAENDLGFYILEKTDYSEHDHDSYLDIFARTQTAAETFVSFILEKSQDSSSSICNLFAEFGNNVNIPISPIKGLASCNGYFVGLNFNTSF